MNKFRFSWFGLLLILIGGAMLLDRWSIVEIQWRLIAWVTIAVLGARMFMSSFRVSKKGRVFVGSLILLIAVSQVYQLVSNDRFPGHFQLPILFIIIGISFLLVWGSALRFWQYSIPALAFCGLGTAILLSEMGHIDRWDVIAVMRDYWPVGVILFGVALIFRRQDGVKT